jgi:hypothetical protein
MIHPSMNRLFMPVVLWTGPSHTRDDEDGLSLSEPTYRQRIQRPLFGWDNELPTTVKEGEKCGGASTGRSRR